MITFTSPVQGIQDHRNEGVRAVLPEEYKYVLKAQKREQQKIKYVLQIWLII